MRLQRVMRCFLIAAVAWSAAGLAGDVANDSVDWPLYGRTHDNQRFSGLRQITVDNVSTLEPRWSFKSGKIGSFQTNPIVIDGVMYVTTPYNDVIALDAANGQQIWRYRHELRTGKTCCGPANRGAAVAHGLVFTTTIDARVIALDQTTGMVAWDVPLSDPHADAAEELTPLLGVAEFSGAVKTGHTGYSANMAPQVVDGLVMIGITGAGYGLHVEMEEDGETIVSVAGFAGGQHGLRGFIVALDAKTGREVWRWHAVPETGWEGQWSATTSAGDPLHRDLGAEKAAFTRYADTWRFGGGSIWTTPAVDRERRLVFLGTGNPAPQMDDSTRPGDNLYTVSLVALDYTTGEMRWHHQQVPHDRWGYDVASPPVLFKLNLNRKSMDVVGQASKTGWFYVYDRDTGEVLLRSRPFVPQENLFARPTPDGVRITPSAYGACSWSPTAVDQTKDLVFIAGIDAPAMYYSRRLTPREGQPWENYTFFKPIAGTAAGLLSAIDLSDGSVRWQIKTDQPLVGGVLATAGGLLFSGEGSGRFTAYRAATGEALWSHETTAGVNAPPITYAIRGRQYVAVAAGGNSLYGFPVGDELIAFALPVSAVP
jgi:glucose dehydrogenase